MSSSAWRRKVQSWLTRTPPSALRFEQPTVPGEVLLSKPCPIRLQIRSTHGCECLLPHMERERDSTVGSCEYDRPQMQHLDMKSSFHAVRVLRFRFNSLNKALERTSTATAALELRLREANIKTQGGYHEEIAYIDAVALLVCFCRFK